MTKCIGIVLFLMLHLNHSPLLSIQFPGGHTPGIEVELKTTYKEVHA